MKRIDLHELARILKGEQIILIKYQNRSALCCDARNNISLNKIQNLADTDILSLLASRKTPFNRYVFEMPSVAWDIIDTSTDPLILLLPKGSGVSKSLFDDKGNIAIRLTNQPLEIDLINKSKCPLAFCFLQGNDAELSDKIGYFYDISSFKYEGIAEPIIYLSENNEVEVIRQ